MVNAMQQRKVVITGMGIIAPSGLTSAAFWKACLQGIAPIEEIPSHWLDYAEYESRIWSPLPPYNPADYGFSRIHRMQYSQSSILGMIAATQALEEAGFVTHCIDEKKLRYRIEDIEPHRCGVYAGTGVGGLVSLIANEASHVFTPQKKLMHDLLKDTPDSDRLGPVESLMRMPARFNPFVVSIIMPNAVSSTIGIRYGLTGENATATSACAAGTVAIGRAFNSIRRGNLDMVIAGGAEYLRDDFGGIFRGFDSAKTLTRGYDDPHRANRPFDTDRNGFLFSEGGAAFLVLEEWNHAQKRGTKPIAEICGFAETFDAYSMMSIASDFVEIERMERMLLADAGFSPESIDYINAHGTGTKTNDEVESAMIKKVYGTGPAVNSTKSLIGHTIGAAGAIEAAVTAKTLQQGITHISKNIDNPVGDINYVREPLTRDFSRAITHSFAFGGHNAGLALRKIQSF